MHYINKNCLSKSDGTTTNGSTLDTQLWVSASFQVFTGGTGDGGTVKIQMSNDPYNANNMAAPANFQPTHWSDVPNATSTVASGVGPPILLANCSYRWLRAVYTASGGSDAVNVQVMAIYP